MSSITPPAESHGTQSLQQTNKTNTDVEAVSHVAAKRAAHQSTDAAITDRPIQSRLVKRRAGDRRREDRRKRKQPVLLDTRSQHDRRISERRSTAKNNFVDKRQFPHRHGVNIKV